MTKPKLIEIPIHLRWESAVRKLTCKIAYISPLHIVDLIIKEEYIIVNQPDSCNWRLKNCPETIEFLKSFVELVPFKPSTTKKETLS